MRTLMIGILISLSAHSGTILQRKPNLCDADCLADTKARLAAMNWSISMVNINMNDCYTVLFGGIAFQRNYTEMYQCAQRWNTGTERPVNPRCYIQCVARTGATELNKCIKYCRPNPIPECDTDTDCLNKCIATGRNPEWCHDWQGADKGIPEWK